MCASDSSAYYLGLSFDSRHVVDHHGLHCVVYSILSREYVVRSRLSFFVGVRPILSHVSVRNFHFVSGDVHGIYFYRVIAYVGEHLRVQVITNSVYFCVRIQLAIRVGQDFVS